MRDRLAGVLTALIACFAPLLVSASSVKIQLLDPAIEHADVQVIAAGSLNRDFRPYEPALVRRDLPEHSTALWLKLQLPELVPQGVPVLALLAHRELSVQLYRGGEGEPLSTAARLPAFAGAQQHVFLLPAPRGSPTDLYARVTARDGSALTRAADLQVSLSSLDEILASGAEHARMIALTFGALMAMSLAALLIWFVLSERLLLLYAVLFGLQALYMAYLSGQGFEWPVLSLALPVISYTWNVCAALSGAAACLFVREIAELRRLSPRVHRLFGWLAVAFVLLSFANLGQQVGLGALVASIGNVMFVGAAITTLVVAFLAWRRENRAAGWFLIAWGLLEAFTIATAIHLLLSDGDASIGLLYYGLPLSMVAAAVLIALGVADRLRDQRVALSDAERRARTDPLTGVLNRGSLLERLDSACLRARARGLPIALLFIDLDHFKKINDTHGHPAGDACLKAIVGPIQAELRQSDVIGRYGGEEFIVILSSADAAAAEPIAERIRNRVAEIQVLGFGAPIRLTCSIGIATSETLGVWGEHLIARADEAVYVAKRSGRNRVQLAARLAA